MKRVHFITIACCLIIVVIFHSTIYIAKNKSEQKDHIKIGILYVGDSCDTYTNNFISAQEAIELQYGDKVEVQAKYNVAEGEEDVYLKELVESKCDLIFATSYGYGATVKKYAEQYPDIEFCMATGDTANTEPVLDNFHNFMGEIYKGRYISGVVAGMKLKELKADGKILSDEIKIGYVGAFPYAEVISGYTSFYLGVASVIPEAKMEVMYSNSWGDYDTEKRITKQLIADGCILISQHSDTYGPAVACEETASNNSDQKVYHVGYNQSMSDIAPTTSLISSKINWRNYMVEATGAVLDGKKIESVVQGNVYGNDISGSFSEGWVKMLRLNTTIAAKGTQEKIDQLVADFNEGNVEVFKGNYIGVDPFDSSDTIDLSNGYVENEKSSAPTFHYVLKDVIECK